MLSIIVALGNDNLIGCNNSLLWHIPQDLKRFKELTSGKKIIMGRKTFESLPFVLPKRHHIVVTNNKNYKVENSCVEICNDLNNMLEKFENSEEEVFIIGGGSIYEKTINRANKLYITYVYKSYKADTFFPKIDENLFEIETEWEKMFSEEEDCFFKYINYCKKK